MSYGSTSPARVAGAVVRAGCGAEIPVRLHVPAGGSRQPPLVLHLPGGAFRQRRRPVAVAPVAALLAGAGAVVVSADYPVGGDHPFPAALEAMFGVLVALAADRSRWAGRRSSLFVAGEEAGGNLAAALAMAARDRHGPSLAGQILVSPMLDPGLATCSIRTAFAGSAACKWAAGWRDYLGAPVNASHPYAAPGSALRLAGLASALILTAVDDPMRDESLAYAARLRESGVPVREFTVRAPTGWPDALAAADASLPEWGAVVREAFLGFFSGVDVASFACISAKGIPA